MEWRGERNKKVRGRRWRDVGIAVRSYEAVAKKGRRKMVATIRKKLAGRRVLV